MDQKFGFEKFYQNKCEKFQVRFKNGKTPQAKAKGRAPLRPQPKLGPKNSTSNKKRSSLANVTLL
jgi:hypothetical protein